MDCSWNVRSYFATFQLRNLPIGHGFLDLVNIQFVNFFQGFTNGSQMQEIWIFDQMRFALFPQLFRTLFWGRGTYDGGYGF